LPVIETGESFYGAGSCPVVADIANRIRKSPMVKHIPIAMAFTLALVASTACIPVNANAQQAAPAQQNQQQESPAATTGKDEQPAQGRLGDAKSGLKLSTEQEKLWGPVEDAMRNLQEKSRTLRSSSGDDQPTDQIGRLRRTAELSTQRGEALKRLADAVQPLWATLSDEQKRELPRIVGVATGQDDQDRMGRGRGADDDRSMDRRRQGRDRRDDDGYSNENGRSGSGGGQRYGRDDDQRRDRTDGSSRRGSQDDYRHDYRHDDRPRSREWNRDRRDFHRHSERHRDCCCCCRN
jgi:hypothetical protein